MAAPSPAMNQGQDVGRPVIVPQSVKNRIDAFTQSRLSAGEGRLEENSSRLGLASLGPLPKVSNGRTAPPSPLVWPVDLPPSVATRSPTTTYSPRANAGESVTERDNGQTGLALRSPWPGAKAVAGNGAPDAPVPNLDALSNGLSVLFLKRALCF